MSPMRHNHIQELLFVIDDPELSEAQRREVAEHLRGCVSCKALSGRLEAIGLAFKKAPAPAASESFVQSVMRALPQAPQPVIGRSRPRLPWWLLPRIGLGFAAAALVFLLIRQDTVIATESLLLADLPESMQWAFANESSGADLLPGVTTELP